MIVVHHLLPLTNSTQSVKAVLGKNDVAAFSAERIATMHIIQEMNWDTFLQDPKLSS